MGDFAIVGITYVFYATIYFSVFFLFVELAMEVLLLLLSFTAEILKIVILVY